MRPLFVGFPLVVHAMAGCACLWIATAACLGEATKTTTAVVQTTLEQPAGVPADATRITFHHSRSAVGDQVDQQMDVRMELKSQIRQGDQIVGNSDSKVHQRQRRRISSVEVREGRTVAAHIHFLQADRQVASGGRSTPPVDDAVAGRVYHCRREGERLHITDEEGSIPPLAEYETVTRAMEALGQQNPLASFFDQRTVAVGERIAVPHEIAARLLGLGTTTLDEVQKFDLTLQHVSQPAGRKLATFAAEIDAAGHSNGQMRMQVEGTLTVEVNSCRLAAADLTGPIGLAETTGGLGATYQISGTGRLKVELRAAYRDVHSGNSATTASD